MAKSAWPGQDGFLQSGTSPGAAVPLSFELPLGTEIPSGSSLQTSTAGPGRLAASDFTVCNELGVKIAGQRFDHTFFHCVLTYSNVESVSLCFSESFESLSAGIQKAFWEFGGVPLRHRSDSLAAAVRNHTSRRELTEPATRASRKKAPPSAKPDRTAQLTDQLKELRLPTIRDRFQESAVRAQTENQSHQAYLSELTTRECEARREGRIKRLMTRSKLHPGKTWDFSTLA